MARYSLNEFVEQTAQKDRGEGLFEMESERILELNLNGMVWTKMGSMSCTSPAIGTARSGAMSGVTERPSGRSSTVIPMV